MNDYRDVLVARLSRQLDNLMNIVEQCECCSAQVNPPKDSVEVGERVDNPNEVPIKAAAKKPPKAPPKGE